MVLINTSANSRGSSVTLPTAEILSGKNARVWVSMDFKSDKHSAPRTIEKMKILGACYQLNSTANPAHLPQNWAYFEVNGLDWQCCLAGSSQRAPRIFIFSIVLGAECLSYLKSIETYARAFSRLISDGIGSVYNDKSREIC